MLCRNYGVQHDGKVAAGGILHSCGDIHAADHQTVLLVLHGTGSDGHIGKDIRKVTPVFRIEHLICCGESGLLNGAHMQFTDSHQTCQHVRFFSGSG